MLQSLTLQRSPFRRILPVIALSLAAALAAPAQAGDGHHRGKGKGHHRHHHDHYERRYDRRDYDRRRDVILVPAPYYPPPRVVYRPGPPPYAHHPRWARGVRYDHRGYAPTYVVRDYRHYDGLYAPPRGYYWRRDDAGNFLLVALATGIIASVLFD